jgi:signal transduction histidine kinase
VSSTQARDAFLARVAQKLDEQVTHAWSLSSGLAHASPLRAALAELVGFARELRIIARPDDPIPLEAHELDLVAVVTRLFDEKRPRLAENGIEIEIQPGGSVLGRFDEQHVATMLFELTSNALKYSAGRPVRITIRPLFEHALLIVANEGSWVGRRTGFERFERGEVRADMPGYGVGLWLTRRLAEAHGGGLRISVRASTTRAIVALPFDRRSGDVGGFSVRLLGPPT